MTPINDSKINHHVSDTYIALFSHFIPCGVWEAIYILEGLLKNTSDIQLDNGACRYPGPVNPGPCPLVPTRDQADAAHPQLEGPDTLSAEQRRQVSAHRQSVQRH